MARRSRKDKLPWSSRILLAVGSLAILAPVVVVGFATGALVGWLHNAPPIEEIDDYQPPEMTLLLDRDGRRLSALYEQRRQVVPLRELPLVLPDAFIAIEDHRFRSHIGIDFPGIARAMGMNLARGRISQGASTITQQTARNVLPEIGNEKTYRRKLLEMLTALQMETRYSKEQILEVYLNQIYLGSGNYGVEAAAQAYFGKSARDLDTAECALLGGLPQIPERYSPLNNADLAIERREKVLARMEEEGYLTLTDSARGMAQPLDLKPNLPVTAGDAAYFVDAVRKELGSLPQLEGERLTQAGLIVETTIEPELQRLAQQTLARGLKREEAVWLAARPQRFAQAADDPAHYYLPQAGQIRMGRVLKVYNKSLAVELPGGWRGDLAIPVGSRSYFQPPHISAGSGVDLRVRRIDRGRRMFEGDLLPETRLQGALVCLDSRSGEVLALAGGRDYQDAANKGRFNRAIQARRQAGSTLKPFFYAAALETGMSPWTEIEDGPIVFSDGYRPRNYEGRFFGPTSLQTGLEHSRNIVTIKMVQAVGLRNALNFLRQFGEPQWHLPLEWPVVLGTTGVTPLELAKAWQPLANAGEAVPVRLIRRVRNAEGRRIATEDSGRARRMLSPRTAAYLTQMLQGVMTRGTGERLRAELPLDLQDRVAGKTGTTNNNRDAWFVGFTPRELVVVWIGFDQDLMLGEGRTGGKVAGPVWSEFVTAMWSRKLLAERRENLPMPGGWVMAPVSPVDGHVLEPGETAPEEGILWRAFREEDVPQASLPANNLSQATGH